jgi:hypothetical protein
MKIRKIKGGPFPINDLTRKAQGYEIDVLGKNNEVFEAGRYRAGSLLNMIALFVKKQDVLTLSDRVEGLDSNYWEEVKE